MHEVAEKNDICLHVENSFLKKCLNLYLIWYFVPTQLIFEAVALLPSQHDEVKKHFSLSASKPSLAHAIRPKYISVFPVLLCQQSSS